MFCLLALVESFISCTSVFFCRFFLKLLYIFQVRIEVVGYLVEELRDKDNLEMFQKDLSDANIFIGSLIFVEELAQKVKTVLEANRDRLDAVIVFPSMPEVMRMNKLGTFSMSQLGQSKSAIAQFMRRKRKENVGNFEEGMLKLVRTLPKVLKYLPTDKAQDARNFIMSLQFWLGGSPENIENFLIMISNAYVPALKGMKLQFDDPVVSLDTGIWHPMAPQMYDDVKEYLNWYSTRRDATDALKDPTAPVVGLILQRSHIVTGDDGHYAAVVMEMEARGAKVVPIFAGQISQALMHSHMLWGSLVVSVVASLLCSWPSLSIESSHFSHCSCWNVFSDKASSICSWFRKAMLILLPGLKCCGCLVTVSIKLMF